MRRKFRILLLPNENSISLLVRYIVTQSGHAQNMSIIGHKQLHSGGLDGGGHSGQVHSIGGIGESSIGDTAILFAGAGAASAACVAGATAASFDSTAVSSIGVTLQGRQKQLGFGHGGQRQAISFLPLRLALVDMGH